MTNTLARPTRRTLVRGAAWSVPVVSLAAAAPAFAASCVKVYDFRLDWNGPSTSYSKNAATNVGTAVVTGPGGSSPLNVTFTSTTSGSLSRASDNLEISSETNIGNLGAGERGLNISHSTGITAGRANRQIVAIAFSRAVTGLSFTMTDIDSNSGNGNNWWDRVELDGTRTAAAVSRGGNNGNYVIGAGTNTNENTTTSGPWRFYDGDSNIANFGAGSNVANLTVTYAGTIPANTPINLTYWSSTGGGNQRIFLTDLTFKAKNC